MTVGVDATPLSREHGPYGDMHDCLRIRYKIGDLEDLLCLDLDSGVPVRSYHIGPGTALGRQFVPGIGAWNSDLLWNIAPLLAGSSFTPGVEEKLPHGTWIMAAHPIALGDGKIQITISQDLYRWVGGDTVWKHDVNKMRFVFDPQKGPFPVLIEFHEKDRFITGYRLVAVKDEGTALAPIQPATIGPCSVCRTITFDGHPPYSDIDGMWSYRDAWRTASAEDAVRRFWERNDETVIVQAEYRRRTVEDPVIGPITDLREVESWRIMIADPIAGEKLEVILQRDPQDGLSRDLKGPEPFAIAVGRSAWPDRLTTPDHAWSAIRAQDPESRLEVLTYNPRIQTLFYDPDPLHFVADPDTGEGMDPHHLIWSIVAGYPDGGGDFFESSAVNGQWLSLPKRYLDAVT